MSQEYSGSAVHEKPERPGFLANSLAFAKSVAKRRLPGGSSKTTGNRDSKARRREEGGQRKGGPSDRRDPTKAKDDLLDVALFESLKKSTVISLDGVPLSPLSFLFGRNWRPSQRRRDQACRLSATTYDQPGYIDKRLYCSAHGMSAVFVMRTVRGIDCINCSVYVKIRVSETEALVVISGYVRRQGDV